MTPKRAVKVTKKRIAYLSKRVTESKIPLTYDYEEISALNYLLYRLGQCDPSFKILFEGEYQCLKISLGD